MTIAIVNNELNGPDDVVALPSDIVLKMRLVSDQKSEAAIIEYEVDAAQEIRFVGGTSDGTKFPSPGAQVTAVGTPVRDRVTLERKGEPVSDYVTIIVTVTSPNGLTDESMCTVLTPIP